MMKSLIAIAVLVACSGAWAEPPPESEGWKRLDFVCTRLNDDSQLYPHFYVSEKEEDEWEDFFQNGGVQEWHYSNEMVLQKNIFLPDGEIFRLLSIDRSTGRMKRYGVRKDEVELSDCELRPENKF